jgi:hypothetical protein
MRLMINVRDLGWWFAAIILVFIVLALGGWQPGYYVVMILSGLQALFFSWRERSLVTIPSQVRIVYFAFSLLGLSRFLRIPIYALLLVGTGMVVFFDRCSIEFLLRFMPWNKNAP